jgi:Zn-dependent protease with chaperone function
LRCSLPPGGFEAIYGRKLEAIVWLVAAALAHLIGRWRFRLAAGMRFRRVKSGELFKRAFSLAEGMKISLKRVYVVPTGRSHLTNAFASPHMIAVTENYRKSLHGPQLDFVIGHELAHAKAKHGIKELAVAPSILLALALAYFYLPVALIPLRPLFDTVVIFLPILASNFVSRCFEFAADEASVAFTKNPKAATQALVNLYRLNHAPERTNNLADLFRSHPSLVRRIRRIEKITQTNTEQPVGDSGVSAS